jgi:hypothetical protein
MLRDENHLSVALFSGVHLAQIAVALQRVDMLDQTY